MMFRKNQNIKNKIRAEDELLDNDLKAAGLWEEGLSLNDKRSLVKLIAESKTSAKEEETRRHVIDSGTVSGPAVKGRNVKNFKNAEGGADSDPEITFESPATHRNSAVISKSETPKISEQNFFPSQSKEKSPPSRPSNEASQSVKHIQSLLSNKSITIQYTPDRPQINSDSLNSKKNVVISETEEESDGDSCPVVINDNDPVHVRELKKQDKPECDVAVLREDKGEDRMNISNVDINLKKLTLADEPNRRSPSSTETGILPVTEQRLNQTSLEVALGKIDNVNNNNNTNSIRTDSLLSTKKNVGKNSVPYIFVPDSISDCDSKPLKVRRKFLSEKPSRAFFKAAYETKTNCVKRIYSLIADWQSALAEYQRTILVPCKWGPPICVDRQLSDSLLRKRSVKCNRVISALSESDESPSDLLKSDQSDEEWNIFTPKRKTKTYRKHYSRRCNTNKQIKSNVLRDEDMDYFARSDEDLLPDIDKGEDSKSVDPKSNIALTLNSTETKESKVAPVTSKNKITNTTVLITNTAEQDGVGNVDPVASTSKCMEVNAPPAKELSTSTSVNAEEVISDSQQENSQSLLALPDNSSAIHKKARRTFQLFENPSMPLKKRDSPCNDSNSLEGSNSPKVVYNLPTTSGEAPQREPKKLNVDTCEDTPDIEEELSVIANLTKTPNQWVTKRGSIRRKCISNSADMPPQKRIISEKTETSSMAFNINAASSTSIKRKEIENNFLNSPANPKTCSSTHSSPLLAGYSIPEADAGSSKQTEVMESLESEIEVEEVQEKSKTLNNNSIQCPLCQLYFPNKEIEFHASECDGSVEAERQQQQQQQQPRPSSSSKNRAKTPGDEPTDCIVLEPRSQLRRFRSQKEPK